MRYTGKDMFRHPIDWWYEWPFRRHCRRLAWWNWLLFEKGQGWLRWGMDTRETRGYYTPPEIHTVFPPLRRVYESIRCRALWPMGFRDEDRMRHSAW